MAVMSKALPMSVSWLRSVPLWAVAGAAGLVTGLVRAIGYGQSADIFGDEVYYWQIGHSVEAGGFPRYRGGLFFLHPPGFFYLEGGWERLFGVHADVVSGVYQMRLLNTLLAGLTAVVLVLLVARVTRSTAAAIAVSAVFALDPFVLRLNGRVLIETSMMLWVLLGYLVLLPLAEEDRPTGARRRAAAAGLLFGLAILTKDVAALITVLPLLAATVFVWPSRRALSLLIASFATVPYAIYMGVVAAAGHFDVLWAVKTHGIRRLLGQVQETGFNSHGTPPLSQRLVEEVPRFGSTYVLLVLAPLALVPLLRRSNPQQRLLALWYMSAGVALAYAVVKGTLEEQELYLLLVPTIVIVATAFVKMCQWREQPTERRRRASVSRVVMIFVLTTTLAWSGVTYAWTRSQPDDGFARLRQYLVENVPEGSPITSLNGSLTLLLQDRYRMGKWSTPEDRARQQVSYVVVPWRLVDEHYSTFTPREARRLTRQGVVLFSFHGRTYGEVALYRLPVPPLSLVTGGAGGSGA